MIPATQTGRAEWEKRMHFRRCVAQDTVFLDGVCDRLQNSRNYQLRAWKSYGTRRTVGRPRESQDLIELNEYGIEAVQKSLPTTGYFYKAVPVLRVKVNIWYISY